MKKPLILSGFPVFRVLSPRQKEARGVQLTGQAGDACVLGFGYFAASTASAMVLAAACLL